MQEKDQEYQTTSSIDDHIVRAANVAIEASLQYLEEVGLQGDVVYRDLGYHIEVSKTGDIFFQLESSPRARAIEYGIGDFRAYGPRPFMDIAREVFLRELEVKTGRIYELD